MAADRRVLPVGSGICVDYNSFAADADDTFPILTTLSAHLQSPILDGSNVLLFPTKEPPAISLAMERLAGHFMLRQRTVKGAKTLVREWVKRGRLV